MCPCIGNYNFSWCTANSGENVPWEYTDEGTITRPGGEWEPIKFLLKRENSTYVPNSQPRIHTRVCQGRIVTTDLPTLGANPKRSRSKSETQEAKDLATLQRTRRTVRDLQADRPRGYGGPSASYDVPFEKTFPNHQYCTLNNGPPAMGPRTVRPITDRPTL
jgi:hypothetical protein